MTTILYNTATNKVAHRIQGEYLVDGQPGIVDLPMIKLIEAPVTPPEYDPATQWRTDTWIVDDVAGEYRQEWTVTDKTLAELQAEVTLNVLSVNRWTIPADNETPVTINYTATDTVHFVVDGTIYPVEPDDLYKATLEITAPEPGPIRVEVRDKAAVVITAEEVVA